MRLIGLLIENGIRSRTPTIPHRIGLIHFGPFFSKALRKITANTIQLAEILIRMSCKKTSVISFLPPIRINQPLHRIDLLVGKLLMLGECRNKRRQRTAEALFHQITDLCSLHHVLRHE